MGRIFILSFVFSFFVLLSYSHAQDDVAFFATPGPTGNGPFIQGIQIARKSIRMEMYHLTDQVAVNALIEAHVRGVDVAVLLDGRSLTQEQYKKVALQLQNGGVKVAASSPAFTITHVKAMIVDKVFAYVTSVNLTNSAATRRDYGIVTKDPSVIREILKVFAVDWENATKRTGNTPQLSDPHLLWSPVDSEAKLVSFINSARSSIYSTVENLGNPAIQNAFVQAATRGIDVRVIVPMCDLNPNPLYNFPFLRSMVQGGVKGHMMPFPATVTQPYIHGKMILVDGNVAYVGSVNFSNNSTRRARELGIFFQNQTAANQLLSIFKSDWTNSVDIPNKMPTNCPATIE